MIAHSTQPELQLHTVIIPAAWLEAGDTLWDDDQKAMCVDSVHIDEIENTIAVALDAGFTVVYHCERAVTLAYWVEPLTGREYDSPDQLSEADTVFG